MTDRVGAESLPLLWGVEAIAVFLGVEERAAFHMLSEGQVPAKKVGRKWVANSEELRQFFNGKAAS